MGLFTFIYIYVIIMTSHRISRNETQLIRRLFYVLDSRGFGVRTSVKVEIIGISHCQQKVTNVNVTLSCHSMTSCFGLITVIFRATIGTKACACQNFRKSTCQLDSYIIAVNSCNTYCLYLIGFAKTILAC
jgi:hypothetical protein